VRRNKNVKQVEDGHRQGVVVPADTEAKR
jgi:hypothetical protein